jgi:hypothetical protein
VAGLNINVLPFKNFKVYGQFLLDDIDIHKLVSDNGYWANKYATQLGFKWIDIFGLPNIDWQSEFNLVRPYTYSERNTSDNYSHYGQALAHPLGANLREFINIIRINTYGPLDIKLKYIFTQQGKDTLNSLENDYGGDIFKSYKLRTGNENVLLLQGILTTTMLAEISISYQLRHNLFIDLNALYRKESSEQYSSSTIYAGLGLRLNFMSRSYDF